MANLVAPILRMHMALSYHFVRTLQTAVEVWSNVSCTCVQGVALSNLLIAEGVSQTPSMHACTRTCIDGLRLRRTWLFELGCSLWYVKRLADTYSAQCLGCMDSVNWNAGMEWWNGLDWNDLACHYAQ